MFYVSYKCLASLTLFKNFLFQQTSIDKSVLDAEIADMKVLVDNLYLSYSTHDSLDAGEALWLTSWCRGEPWAEKVFQTACDCVAKLYASGEFNRKKFLNAY